MPMGLAAWVEYRYRALLVRLIDLEGDAVALGVLGAIARGILVQTVIEALEEVTMLGSFFASCRTRRILENISAIVDNNYFADLPAILWSE